MVAIEDHLHNPDIHNHQVEGLDVETLQGRNTGPESSDFGHTSRRDHQVCGMVDAMVPSRCWPRLRSPSSERRMHRPIVRLVFTEVFLCRTGFLFDDLQWHGRHGSDCCGVGTVSGSLGGRLPTHVFHEVVRKRCAVATSWLFVCGFQRMQTFPWVLAVSADSGQSDPWKRNICMQLFGASPSQLHVSVPERLRGKLTAHDLDGSVLLSGMWQRMLVLCSWLVDASVSHVEFVHGRNKRRACRSELWAHFISKHILEDIMCAMKHVPEAYRAFGRAPLGVRTPRVRTSCIKDVFSKDLKNRPLKANTTSTRANTLECADELAQGFCRSERRTDSSAQDRMRNIPFCSIGSSRAPGCCAPFRKITLIMQPSLLMVPLCRVTGHCCRHYLRVRCKPTCATVGVPVCTRSMEKPLSECTLMPIVVEVRMATSNHQ